MTYTTIMKTAITEYLQCRVFWKRIFYKQAKFDTITVDVKVHDGASLVCQLRTIKWEYILFIFHMFDW